MGRLRMALTKKLPMKYHSPAGRRHLKRKKKKKKDTQPIYFKNVRRPSDISRLRDAGVTEEDLKALGYK
jgi:hypothetical protein